MKTKEMKRVYKRPAMQVVELSHMGMLMVSGPVGLKNYNMFDYYEE